MHLAYEDKRRPNTSTTTHPRPPAGSHSLPTHAGSMRGAQAAERTEPLRQAAPASHVDSVTLLPPRAHLAIEARRRSQLNPLAPPFVPRAAAPHNVPPADDDYVQVNDSLQEWHLVDMPDEQP